MAASAQDPVSDRARSRVGAVLRDKWRLDALLGVGGMAAVYSATHRNGMRAAVKILHPPAAADPAVRARFLREGYLANKVGHPGAVAILDDDEAEDGSVYLVMELLEGDTIEDLRVDAGGKLPAGDVLVIADKALDVLAAAHEKKIVHRDIKPGNLFMTTTGVLKVLDFGIARLTDSSQGRVVSAGGPTTYSSSMGTVGFMAPEQARGRWELVDARTDLWSLGASMFTLLSGRMAHEAATTNEQLLAAMTEPAPPVAKHVPGLNETVALAVDQALAYERNERWPDARTMQAAVREAYLALTGRAVAQAPRIAGRLRRSVPPQAYSPPTLPAASGPTPRDARAPAPTTGTRRRPRLVPLGVIVACIAAAVVVGVYVRGKHSASAATSTEPKSTTQTTNAASEPTSNPTSTSTTTREPTTFQTALVGAPAFTAADKGSVPARATPTGTPPAPHASASAKPHAVQPMGSAPSPSSSASVDIFGRRL